MEEFAGLIYGALGLITYWAIALPDRYRKRKENPNYELGTDPASGQLFVICMVAFPLVWMMLLSEIGGKE